MNSWSRVLGAVRSAWATTNWCRVGVVVGCSGGADSVCLLRALSDILRSDPANQGFLVVGHFHHGLRAREADEDAEFVEQLAQQVGWPCVVECPQDIESAARDEAGMRDARLDFLRRTAQQHGCRYVALAHSSDDNVETILHHLFRGTGPRGLCGIPPFRTLGTDPLGQDLIMSRPLLSLSRDLIRQSMRDIGQLWREDSSNQDDRYQRNWIRQELLPVIKSRYPESMGAIDRTINSMKQWSSFLDSAASNWISKHVEHQASDDLVIQCDGNANQGLLIHAMQMLWMQRNWSMSDYTARHWERLAVTIAFGNRTRYSLPGNIDVQVADKTVRVSPPKKTL